MDQHAKFARKTETRRQFADAKLVLITVGENCLPVDRMGMRVGIMVLQVDRITLQVVQNASSR